MANIFIASDHHIDHANILTFMSPEGTPLRSFKDVQDMAECMITRHNAIVKPQDKVYFLGDFCMRKQNVHLAAMFNGHKRLVRGNHDDAKTSEYLKYFNEVYSSRLLDRTLLLTHIPVHPGSLKPEWTNVHGHTHSNQPQGWLGSKYYNVCVEMIDYTPVALEDLKLRIAAARKVSRDKAMQHLIGMGVTNFDELELE